MAVFQIEEFSAIGHLGVQVPQYPPVAIQALTVGASSVASSAFAGNTWFARIVSDTACHFKVGPTAPTAASNTTSSYLPANVPIDIGVQPGYFIAVITG
jgi:hypothetical protein